MKKEKTVREKLLGELKEILSIQFGDDFCLNVNPEVLGLGKNRVQEFYENLAAFLLTEQDLAEFEFGSGCGLIVAIESCDAEPPHKTIIIIDLADTSGSEYIYL